MQTQTPLRLNRCLARTQQNQLRTDLREESEICHAKSQDSALHGAELCASKFICMPTHLPASLPMCTTVQSACPWTAAMSHPPHTHPPFHVPTTTPNPFIPVPTHKSSCINGVILMRGPTLLLNKYPHPFKVDVSVRNAVLNIPTYNGSETEDALLNCPCDGRMEFGGNVSYHWLTFLRFETSVSPDTCRALFSRCEDIPGA
eukprot:763006-Hanusia_phi.AAC.4